MVDFKQRRKRIAGLVILVCVTALLLLTRMRHKLMERWEELKLLANTESVEQVLRFDSQLIVKRSGSVEVFEWITVRILGRQIKRGFCRGLPLELREGENPARHVSYHFMGATRDDQPLNAQMINQNDYTEVCLGDEATELPRVPGDYVYVLHYGIEDLVQQTETSDRIYWDITGVWPIPIKEGSFSLILPPLTEAAGVQATSKIETKLVEQRGSTIVAPQPSAEIIGKTAADPERKDTNIYSFTFPNRSVAPGEIISTSIQWAAGMVERKGKEVVLETPSPSPGNP